MSSAENAVLKTLAWHALFDFPLTAEEVRVTALARLNLTETFLTLTALTAAGRVGEQGGFYFLAGRSADAAERLVRYNVAERKFARARRFLSVARFLPFVRAAFVCNTLARSAARPESDIDLLIVTRHRHAWSARLLVTGLAALFRLRPKPDDAIDGLCLSFYASEAALDFRSLALPGDEYLPRWIADLYPIYDEAGISEKIFVANRWILETVPNALAPRASARRTLASRALSLKRLAEYMLGWLEPWAKRLQKRLLPDRLRAGGPGIVLTGDILKFHDRDRREELGRRFRAILGELGLKP